MRDSAVILEKVSKSYNRRDYLFKNIDLDVKEGEIVLISGPSGCGKTTLLNLIGGLDTPSSGRIYVGGNNISKLGENALARVRLNHVGFVFQSYNLINDLTIAENVALPRKLARLDWGKRVKYLLSRFGLENLARKYPHEISGGEAQRVAIARALANQPKVVLADEPTGNLDRKSSWKVMETFRLMNTEFNTTLIIVSHEYNIDRWASIHYRLDAGKLVKVESERTRKIEENRNAGKEVYRGKTGSASCDLCHGSVKKDSTIVKCPCGNIFHEGCSSQAGKCPKCDREL